MKVVVSKENLTKILDLFIKQIKDNIDSLDINNLDLSNSDLIVINGDGNSFLSNNGQMVNIDQKAVSDIVSDTDKVTSIIKLSKNENGEYTYTTNDIDLIKDKTSIFNSEGVGDKFLSDNGEYIQVVTFIEPTDSEIDEMVDSLE